MRVVALLLVIGSLIPVCAQTVKNNSLPQVVTFVAPPYPRLASDGSMTGTTVTRIKVGKDGRVSEADVVSAHPIFAKYVVVALKQWKFTPSEQEYVFEVVCRFEFYGPDSPDQCFREDGEPNTPETVVSARLPTDILIRTTGKCITFTTSDPVENRR
jgi:TonB family protein